MPYEWMKNFTPGPFADLVLGAGKLVEVHLNPPADGAPKNAYILIAYQSPEKLALSQVQIVTNIQDEDAYKGILAQIGMTCEN